MNIGHNLKRLREKKGISQEALQVLSGMHRTAISRIENGHVTNLRTTTLQALAKALKVNINELLDGIE